MGMSSKSLKLIDTNISMNQKRQTKQPLKLVVLQYVFRNRKLLMEHSHSVLVMDCVHTILVSAIQLFDVGEKSATAGRNLSGVLSSTAAVAFSGLCHHTHQQCSKRILDYEPLISCCEDISACASTSLYTINNFLRNGARAPGAPPPKSAPGLTFSSDGPYDICVTGVSVHQQS